MGDTSTLDILTAVGWLIRDLAVLYAFGYAVIGLFDRQIRANAAAAWIVGLLGLIASMTGDYGTSLLGVSDGLVILGLIVSGVLIWIPLIRSRRSKSASE